VALLTRQRVPIRAQSCPNSRRPSCLSQGRREKDTTAPDGQETHP
jgi:hypothetical protein